MRRQRVLPVVTVNNTRRYRSSPLFSTAATTTTATADTTTTRTPSGESTGGHVLPPINISDVLSRDQLRQRTERIIWRSVHEVPTPTHTDVAAATTTVEKDAESAPSDTVAATTTVDMDAVPDVVNATVTAASHGDIAADVNESTCDTGEGNEMSESSANVSSDNMDSIDASEDPAVLED